MKTIRLFTALQLIIAVMLLWLLIPVAHAQLAPSEIPPDYLTEDFRNWQLNLNTLFVVFFLLGRAFKALRNGGGLVGVWRGIIFGENVPKGVIVEKENLNPKEP